MTYDARSESERRTRRQRIDPMLRAVGWTIVPFDESRPLAACSNDAIEEYPPAALVKDLKERGLLLGRRLVGSGCARVGALRREWRPRGSTGVARGTRRIW